MNAWVGGDPAFGAASQRQWIVNPLTQATVRRAQGSRSFRADFEALRADRDQALTQLLNA